MKQYIFITCEGFTNAPWNDKIDEAPKVENAQVLGRAWGENQQDAQYNLLKENPWIIEVGFDPYEIISYELAEGQ